MIILVAGSNGMVGSGVLARGGGVRNWQRWAPPRGGCMVIDLWRAGSLLGGSGRGFPYNFRNRV